MHSLSIGVFWNSKTWIGWLIRLFMNCKIHIKFHFKLFTVIKYVFKNEVIKSSVELFLENLE